MVKKGKIQEIFSKALYYDDPSKYIITYRDFERHVQSNLKDFLSLSDNFQIIPASRIIKIEREGEVLYEKKLK